ncbi:subtilisin-like serine protease [Rubidibacter lacunae KORDI 51-2]|uniref:Subtilisin-like serine protease n=1 Tax=Rubidibacter lacunae KORDI 51-2 TaxID=582515 RepID=U5DIM8_9CHRO|nr:S8 family serine peptidase [Rubidibacter lacunae]ERN40797.1 subtilisin-like serine protease [Rubidibacter lacunae KORDI 51-2]
MGEAAVALEDSVGDRGIGARQLHAQPYNLTGRKIAIGQVEVGRPQAVGLDKGTWYGTFLNVVGAFYRDRPAVANEHLDAHAQLVAMVMVSQDKRLRGVAPGAHLFSAALGSLQGAGQPEECLTTQHVAEQNGNDVRAINFSFGDALARDPRENARLDGNALLTQCVDWSARVHDTLYSIAGNQGRGGIQIPTDNYNGISIAYTARRNGEFAKVDFANLSARPEGIGRRLIRREINFGPRRSISLVAPGSQIELLDLDGDVTRASGTSFAAPHLTATVALLQEYGDRVLHQLRGTYPDPQLPPWSDASRQHEVMKAVLLNSAEKVRDPGDGNLLGMERTVMTKTGDTWLDSDAASDPEIPLDLQLGTGQLDAFRAYQQFAAGQWSPDALVPPRGWDYREIEVRTARFYKLAQPLPAGSFAAITIAWDRLVELQDRDGDDRYDIGETFRDRGLNDLNVYLESIAGTGDRAIACASASPTDSVEHIFCPVPQSGRYAIRVEFARQVNEPTQVFAIAWWTAPVGFETPEPAGRFDPSELLEH